MSAYNPHLRRSLRFCELCGQFMGNLTRKEWNGTFHLCQECIASRESFVLIARDKSQKEWDGLWRKS
jgi:hypothetical protein